MVYVKIVFFFFLIFSFKARRGLQKLKLYLDNSVPFQLYALDSDAKKTETLKRICKLHNMSETVVEIVALRKKLTQRSLM